MKKQNFDLKNEKIQYAFMELKKNRPRKSDQNDQTCPGAIGVLGWKY